MSDSREPAALVVNEPAEVTTSNDSHVAAVSPAKPQKSFFQAALPVFAAGAGLFSDGYVGNVSQSLLRPPFDPRRTLLW